MIGEDPRLWDGVVVRIYNNNFNKLTVQRFQLMKEVKVTCTGFRNMHVDCHWTEYGMSELFKVLHDITKVRRLLVPNSHHRGGSGERTY